MSEVNHARRGFLRGRFRQQTAPVRPPWALPEDDFLARCTRCGNCAIICPTKIIRNDEGHPRIDFSAGECTFCAECVRVCMPAALSRTGEAAPWTIKAQIGTACVAGRGVACRICGDQCAVGVIRFPLRAAGTPAPELLADACTGCGACVAPCPVRAIAVR